MQIELENKGSREYIFHRKDTWYPIELYDDKDAIQQAKNNPGTTAVEDAVTGKIIWTDKMITD